MKICLDGMGVKKEKMIQSTASDIVIYRLGKIKATFWSFSKAFDGKMSKLEQKMYLSSPDGGLMQIDNLRTDPFPYFTSAFRVPLPSANGRAFKL